MTLNDLALEDLALEDLALESLGFDVESFVEWQSDMLSTVAQVGSAWSGPSIGDADGNRLTLDWENRWIPVKAEEIRVAGARRVENLLTASEDLTDSAWLANQSATRDDADTVTLAAIQYSGIRQAHIPGADYANKTYRMSADITWVSGDTDLSMQIDNDFEAITVSATTKRFSITGSFSGAATRYVYPVLNRSTSPTETVVKITNVQLEDVTGQTNTNPSEYVSTGVESSPYHGAGVDGVKYFSTENGNTVSSNVVTEATGAALSDIKGYFAEGAATELSGRSNDFSNWTSGGTPTAAQNAVGLSGSSNEAWTLTDDDGAFLEDARHIKGISDDTSTYYAVFRVGYVASPTTYPMLYILLYGGTSLTESICFDQSDGTYAESGTDGSVVSVTRRQGPFDHWEVILSLTNNGTGNINSRVSVFPAFNTDGTTTGDVTATGSIVIASAELYKDNYSFSPILTTGGTTKTRLADTEATLPFDWDNVDAEGSIEFELTPFFDAGYTLNQGIITPASGSGSRFIYFSSIAKTIVMYDGANAEFTAGWSAIGETVAIKAVWGSGRFRLSVGGVADDSETYDGSFNPAGLVTAFKGLARAAAVKDVVVHNSDLGDSWL